VKFFPHNYTPHFPTRICRKPDKYFFQAVVPGKKSSHKTCYCNWSCKIIIQNLYTHKELITFHLIMISFYKISTSTTVYMTIVSKWQKRGLHVQQEFLHPKSHTTMAFSFKNSKKSINTSYYKSSDCRRVVNFQSAYEGRSTGSRKFSNFKRLLPTLENNSTTC